MYSGSKSRKNQKTPEGNVPASGDTSETPTKESDDKSWLTCYNCRGTGHHARNCPSPRVQRGGAPSRGPSRGRRPRRGRGQPPTANPALIDRANYHTHIYHGMMKVYLKNTRQCLMHAKREDNNLYRVLGEVITENQVVWENPADSKPTGRLSNDKFYDAKELLEDSENEDNDLSLTPVKTPGPAAQRRDALPPVQPAAIHSPLQKLQKLKPPRPTSVAVWKHGRDGFDREEVTRTTGGSAGQVDVYYYGPDGKRLRSRKEVKDYCTANGLTYEILDFDFSSNRPVTSTLLDDPVDVG
uniref:CCHC-type domain-containing protein n=1 Tax=Strigamia maritima TaxID=126957 RepID=T1ILA7_STRMM